MSIDHWKAIIGTAFFAIIGTFFAFNNADSADIMKPQILFYAILVVNSYFSIYFFSKIIPKDNVPQHVIDAILGIMYVVLAYYLGHPFYFIFVAMLIFIVACEKYVLMFNVVPHHRVLKRKISIDFMGAVTLVLALIGIHEGHVSASLWITTICFFVANIVFLLIWPMYSLK